MLNRLLWSIIKDFEMITRSIQASGSRARWFWPPGRLPLGPARSHRSGDSVRVLKLSRLSDIKVE